MHLFLDKPDADSKSHSAELGNAVHVGILVTAP